MEAEGQLVSIKEQRKKGDRYPSGCNRAYTGRALGKGMFAESGWMKTLLTVIYSFHMPLFFWLSGLVFAKVWMRVEGKLSGGEVKYLWNLFLLYCFWSGVMYVFKGLFSGVVNAEYRENFLYCLLFAPVGPYWYLITLLYYYLLGFGLLKILREKSETGKKLLFAILVFHGKPDVTVWISAVLSSVFLLGRNFFI